MGGSLLPARTTARLPKTGGTHLSYYTDTTKKVRHDNAMLAMRLGCPEGALTVPEHPIAYYVSGGVPGEPSAITLITYRWSPSGKCTARVWELEAALFDYANTSFYYHYATGSLLPIGKDAPVVPESVRQLRLQAAYTMFKGTNARMPSTAAKGDTVEASRRGYVRRQANALLKHMPDGYALVPGCERTAYRVFNHGTFMRVSLVAATTKGHTLERGESGALKVNEHRYYGGITVEGKAYKLDGMRLVPVPSHSLYPAEFEQYAQAVRNDAFDQAAEACRPFGKTGAVIATAIRNKLHTTEKVML